MPPVLVLIGGLPGTGKSTIAAALAKATATPYLRVDRIEQAVVAWTALSHPVGPVGYAVAHQLALEQLELGLDVIVECVNPVALTRDAWPAHGCCCRRPPRRGGGDVLRRDGAPPPCRAPGLRCGRIGEADLG